MEKQNIISKRVMDFSLRPGPRYFNQGPSSGEEFYARFLNPWFKEALKANALLEVVLDGTDGYLASFIDEAFGRLVYDFGLETVKNNLIVVSNLEPEWKSIMNRTTFPVWQTRRERCESPKHTLSA